ncbi:MAG: type I-C CRISPR-associated protein Cas7/Csd2 [Armatimonadetes bacterium]|nr:type I-C CRISPR-associated protein Cas7/Csd2 [Armatimonadota bacterium]
MCDPGKRYDFLLLFDVSDGNPNGDPDAGNLPRLDPETMQGIVTDVCLKRKIRNYVDMVHQSEGKTDNDNGIFVRDSGVALNTKLREAALAADTEVEKNKKKENKKGREEMCKRYYDVRMFGGVLSTGDYNCGQVRGPMQLTFSRSVDPIVPSDIAITRVAITKEGEQNETEIGRKAQVPYGLYLGKGFFSPMLAKDTGVSEADLRLFWLAVLGMFENDRSASRGYMELRGVYVFRHDNALGSAPSGKLFERVHVKRNEDVEAPRKFEEYAVVCNGDALPEGITLHSLLD